MGKDLIEKQKAYKWGDQFLEQFSHDMRQALPEMQGFSKRNLEHMRRFYTLYPNIEFRNNLFRNYLGVILLG